MKAVYYLYMAAGFMLVYIILRLRKKLIIGWRMRRIDRSTGEEFEKYLYYKFQQMGYRVRHTGKSGDYGADLILYSKKTKEKIVVQAKRYNQKIGQEAVREAVAATAFYKADRAIVVTNSKFTEYAKNLAEKNNVALYDRDWLYKIVQKKVKVLPEVRHINTKPLEFTYIRTISSESNSLNAKILSHEIDEYLSDKGYEVTPISKIKNKENTGKEKLQNGDGKGKE